jgi:hypothetical protein
MTGARSRRVGAGALFLTAVALVSLAGRPLMAEEAPVARLDKIEGNVNVVRSGGEKAAAVAGLSLYAGDTLVTEKGGTAWFSFLNSTGRLKVAENSEVSIDELSGAQGREDPPTLRLALGYLKSKCAKIGSQSSGLTLHTPTAVAGVRGTEFDTVVSADGTCVIVVDEGAVELEAEEERTLVNEGRMANVDMAGKPSVPVPAIPQGERDWKAWREKRIEMLLEHLSERIGRFRNRFERAVFRSKRFTTTVNEAAEEVNAAMLLVRRGMGERNPGKVAGGRRLLRERVPAFRELVEKFRGAANRVRAMGTLSLRVETSFNDNRARFSPQEITAIESGLAGIALKRSQLKRLYRPTVFHIRSTFRELRELKEESRRPTG